MFITQLIIPESRQEKCQVRSAKERAELTEMMTTSSCGKRWVGLYGVVAIEHP